MIENLALTQAYQVAEIQPSITSPLANEIEEEGEEENSVYNFNNILDAVGEPEEED